MNPFVRVFHSFVGTRAAPKKVRRAAPGQARRWQPCLEVLEDRTVPSAVSAITSNFNGTAIHAGDYLWFSSVADVKGVGSSPVTLSVTNQTITFAAAGTSYTLTVPDTVLTLSPGASGAVATFNGGANAWNITVRTPLSGNVLLGGLSYQTPSGLPGGINPVTWTATFSTDAPGITVNWKWAAAVYSQFSSDHAALGVKPVDDNHLSQYQNSDHAGTPENFKSFVLGGARGGGGSNWTGSYSATKSVVPSPAPTPPSGSLSGFVYLDNNLNSTRDDSDSGIAGVLVTLTGTDDLGNAVQVTLTTDVNGFYSFTGLRAGTYSLVKTPPSGYTDEASNVGTVGGNGDGTTLSPNAIAQIVLGAGQNGLNYNFAELLAGS
jgi:hypothetical protein